jgi:hypothetical protein
MNRLNRDDESNPYGSVNVMSHGLARKGNLTIVENAEKTIIALQSGPNVVSLEGGPRTAKAQLLYELCLLVQDWPNTES